MTEKEEAAANWEMYEKYRKLVASQATLRERLTMWGKELYAVGHHLTTGVDHTDSYGHKLINLPEKAELQIAVKEFIDLQSEIARLRKSLRAVGMDQI
jgi:hypothetical protein